MHRDLDIVDAFTGHLWTIWMVLVFIISFFAAYQLHPKLYMAFIPIWSVLLGAGIGSALFITLPERLRRNWQLLGLPVCVALSILVVWTNDSQLVGPIRTSLLPEFDQWSEGRFVYELGELTHWTNVSVRLIQLLFGPCLMLIFILVSPPSCGRWNEILGNIKVAVIVELGVVQQLTTESIPSRAFVETAVWMAVTFTVMGLLHGVSLNEERQSLRIRSASACVQGLAWGILLVIAVMRITNGVVEIASTPSLHMVAEHSPERITPFVLASG